MTKSVNLKKYYVVSLQYTWWKLKYVHFINYLYLCFSTRPSVSVSCIKNVMCPNI